MRSIPLQKMKMMKMLELVFFHKEFRGCDVMFCKQSKQTKQLNINNQTDNNTSTNPYMKVLKHKIYVLYAVLKEWNTANKYTFKALHSQPNTQRCTFTAVHLYTDKVL